jgi:hypothetical protein
MAKRKRIMNIEKMHKEGRGQGIGTTYKPWLKIQDVPSLGRATRLKGIKTGRQHEFLSDMERNYFYFLEFTDEVTDIREQFPLLPIEDTLLIADELGIKHPSHPQTGEPIIMTTDFLVNVIENNKHVELVRTIKSKDDLLNKRVLEKFEIERLYWQKRGISWGIVTEKDIDKVIAHNISSVHNYKDITNLDCFINIEASDLKDLVYEFMKRIIDAKRTMRVICNEFDNDMSLEKGSGLSIFKYLIINKIIEINISEKIDVNAIISILNVREEAFKRVEVL